MKNFVYNTTGGYDVYAIDCEGEDIFIFESKRKIRDNSTKHVEITPLNGLILQPMKYPSKYEIFFTKVYAFVFRLKLDE